MAVRVSNMDRNSAEVYSVEIYENADYFESNQLGQLTVKSKGAVDIAIYAPGCWGLAQAGTTEELAIGSAAL